MDDIKLTTGEAKSIETAFSQKEFRDILAEYMKDISDPKHREEREEYLRILEARNDIPENKKILHPQVGYVIKFKVTRKEKSAATKVKGNQKSKSSSKKNTEIDSKFFINIVSSEHIDKPSCKKTTTNSLKGKESQWSLPYSVGPIRMERDNNKGNKNLVPTLDCCFHPLALYFGKTNPAFRHLIATTAREGADAQNVKMGDKDAILLSDYHILTGVSYTSGKPSIMVIGCAGAEAEADNSSSSSTKKNSAEKKAAPILNQENTTGTGNEDSSTQIQRPVREGTEKCNALTVKKGFLLKEEEPSKSTPSANKEDEHMNVLVPFYEVIEMGEFDLADHTLSRPGPSKSAKSTRPKYLEYRIKLPGLQSSEGLVLDISEKRLDLQSEKVPGCSKEVETKYLLSIPTPYAVQDGTAKFDQTTSTLKVSLPVVEATCKAPTPTCTIPTPYGHSGCNSSGGCRSPSDEIKEEKKSNTKGEILLNSSDDDEESSRAQLKLTTEQEDCSYVKVEKPKYNNNAHDRWLEVTEEKDILDGNAVVDEAYYKAIRIAKNEVACGDESAPTSARESYDETMFVSTMSSKIDSQEHDLHNVDVDGQSASLKTIDDDFAIIERDDDDDTESPECMTIISLGKSLTGSTNASNSQTRGQFTSPSIFELD